MKPACDESTALRPCPGTVGGVCGLAARLGDDLSRLHERLARADLSLRQEFVNQPHADVVAHLLKLGIGGVDLLVILDQLRHDGAIGQGEELGIDLLHLGEGHRADSLRRVRHAPPPRGQGEGKFWLLVRPPSQVRQDG